MEFGEKGYKLNSNAFKRGIRVSNQALQGAVLGRHFSFVKFLVESQREWGFMFAVVSAARIGSLDLVKYLVRNGFPASSLILLEVAASGNLEIFLYLRRLNQKHPADKNLLPRAAK